MTDDSTAPVRTFPPVVRRHGDQSKDETDAQHLRLHPWVAEETVHPEEGGMLLLRAYGLTREGALETWHQTARRLRCRMRYPGGCTCPFVNGLGQCPSCGRTWPMGTS